MRSTTYVALFIAVFGQFLFHLLASVLSALAVPCCDSTAQQLPDWYANLATPVHFAVMLLPALLCGRYVQDRPILVGTLAAGVGAFLWHWLGAHVLATFMPSRAIGGIGNFANALHVFGAPGYLAGLLISSACYAAAGACAASAGHLLRGWRDADSTFRHTTRQATSSGSRPAN